MRSPLDDVVLVHGETEIPLRQILVLVVLSLIIFSLAYWVIFPNRAEEGHSSLAWEKRPVWVPDDNATLNVGSFVFSVFLSSFEKSDTMYRFSIEFEKRIIATKNVSLSPGAVQSVDFLIPVRGAVDPRSALRVRASKIVSDANAGKDDVPLELVDYFDS